MKITHIAHASILIEAQGLAILSDPWWNGPCFGSQWWVYPKPYLGPLQNRAIDYIYISHGHHDHLHPGTLNKLDKSAKILASSALDICQPLRDLGFEVIEIYPGRDWVFPGSTVKIRIQPTHGDDTFMIVDDGQEVCLNLNDALHSAPAEVQNLHCSRLTSAFPKIDYLFCGYGVASHFPNCYRIPGKDMGASAAYRQAYFNRQWVRIVDKLQPKFAFPFAADVVFLQKELMWSNEATHNAERPTDVYRSRFPSSPVQVIDIAPGFEIQAGHILADVRRVPLKLQTLEAEMAGEIQRSNRAGGNDQALVDRVMGYMRMRLENCSAYLQSYPGDYRIKIVSTDGDGGVVLSKTGERVRLEPCQRSETADLTFITRWPYMEWALREPYGHELLFVGSGGIFDYSTEIDARRNLHRELITLIRNNPPAVRALPSQGLIAGIKRLIKRALGHQSLDLYDLELWTIRSVRSR